MIGNAKVISFINLKGGVGKTTTAVNVAVELSRRSFTDGSKTRVLLIDLDPQSNASISFLSEDQYQHIQNQNTLKELFLHALSPSNKLNPQSFDLTTIRYRLEYLKSRGCHLDLIPCSLDIIDLQDRLTSFRSPHLSPMDILGNALHQLQRNNWCGEQAYTHIVVDCPPSLGMLTMNALSISDYFVVPTFLDQYSYWGLHKIVERMDALRQSKASCNIKLLGVLFSKVDPDERNQENVSWRKKFNSWCESEQNKKNLKKLCISEKIIFDAEIPSYEVIRKSESFSKPLLVYPAEGNDKNKQAILLSKYTSLVNEMFLRMNPKKSS